MPFLQDQKQWVADSERMWQITYYVDDLVLIVRICNWGNDELVKRQSVLFSRHKLVLFILLIFSFYNTALGYIIATRRKEIKDWELLTFPGKAKKMSHVVSLKGSSLVWKRKVFSVETDQTRSSYVHRQPCSLSTSIHDAVTRCSRCVRAAGFDV